MKLTIAFDDISLPLPPMRRPDIRQMVIEQVLEMAAAAGVDDVHVIAALALHRRMTEAELRHTVGDRTYDAFAPSGCLYNHDAEDPDGMVVLGTTPHGEEVQFSKRAAGERSGGVCEHQPGGHGRRAQEHRHRLAGLPGAAAPPQRQNHAGVQVRSWISTAPSCTPPTGEWARCCATPG